MAEFITEITGIHITLIPLFFFLHPLICLLAQSEEKDRYSHMPVIPSNRTTTNTPTNRNAQSLLTLVGREIWKVIACFFLKQLEYGVLGNPKQ
jgi:hypothetical protein